MVKFLFLIPLTLCLVWVGYLKQFGYSLEQGRKGFIYIAIFSGVIAAFYGALLWLTHL